MWYFENVFLHCPDAWADAVAQQARARIEFGKFNFARDSDHCRFYLRRFSTTIYNVLFVSAVFDLFPRVRTVRQARFFWMFAISANCYQFYAIVTLDLFHLADKSMSSNDRRLLRSDHPCSGHGYVVPLNVSSASSDTVAVPLYCLSLTRRFQDLD